MPETIVRTHASEMKRSGIELPCAAERPGFARQSDRILRDRVLKPCRQDVHTLQLIPCIPAACSPHKVGKAVDFLCHGHSPRELYEAFVAAGGMKSGFLDRTDEEAAPWSLLARYEYFPGMTWTHVDVMDQLGNTDGSIRVISG